MECWSTGVLDRKNLKNIHHSFKSNRSRVQRFRVQGSAPPLAAEAAGLIEEEAS
jgi:hypothetical protein